jgi:hypothetical protein
MTGMVGQHRCGETIVIRGLHVGSMICKCAHHLDVSVIRRNHQRRHALAVLVIYLGTARQQLFELSGLSGFDDAP